MDKKFFAAFLVLGIILVAVAMIYFPSKDTNQEQIYCKPESRNAGACIALYKPVCGWFDPAKIQCIRYPCAQTFSNSCHACIDDKVLYYTDGVCPS